MDVQRLTVIEDAELIEELWQFYEEAFADLNEESPIAQTWPREGFEAWMSNERVIVIVIRIENEVAAMGVVTNDISIEPLLSRTYFAKYHPNGAWYFPAIAVARHHRSNIRVARKLIECLMAEISAGEEVVAYLFFSTEKNASLAKLVVRFCKGRIVGEVVGTESCFRMTWKNEDGETP